MNLEQIFGEELRKLREENGLSQEQYCGEKIKLAVPIIENCACCCREIESKTISAVCPFCGEMNICCHACEEWIEEQTENCYRCEHGSYFVEGHH